MPQSSRALRALLSAWLNQTPPCGPSSATDDVDQVVADQRLARLEVDGIATLHSTLSRAEVPGAVRHQLRLPLGLERPGSEALRLIRADESSVLVGSTSMGGTEFRGELVVRECTMGSMAQYAVERWHELDGAICGLQQLQHVRRTIVRAVLAADPGARASGVVLDDRE